MASRQAVRAGLRAFPGCWMVLLVALGAGCGPDPQGPSGTGIPDSGGGPVRDAGTASFLASAPIAGTALAPEVAGAALGGAAAFVAAATGTFAGESTVEVTNPRKGVRVPVLVRDGGFDPVAIAASEGDTLVVNPGSSASGAVAAVKGRAPVRVVRASPSPQQTDVPLNARVEVIFSAPIELASLEGRMSLRRNGIPVAGRLAHGDASQTTVAFLPDAALEPQASYEIVLAAGIADAAGNTLQDPHTFAFTTGAALLAIPDNMVLLFSELPFNMGFGLNERMATLATSDGLATWPLGLYGAQGMTWSPDGRWIAFVTDGPWGTPQTTFRLERADVYLLSVAGGAIRRLTSDGGNYSPRWLPDGQGIAFVHRDAQGWGRVDWTSPASIHSVEVDGTGRRVRTGPEPPDRSPDATRIIWADAQGVWVSNADGSGAVLVGPGGHTPRWSPRGDLIAYVTGTWDAYEMTLQVVAPDGTGRRHVFRRQELNIPLGILPVWSPDGAVLMYQVNDYFLGNWSVTYRADADGGESVEVPLPNWSWVTGWRR